MTAGRKLLAGSAAAAAATGVYLGLVTSAAPFDLGVGRRTRPLGPIDVDIAAPPGIVFDVLMLPYAERPSRAMKENVRVLARGSDMVLAAHYTPVRGGLTATTVETVRFDRPERIDFRLVRGPVPHVVETFLLEPKEGGTRLLYTGEMGTDLWTLGTWWGDVVARPWEQTVSASLAAAKAEAERRHNG